MAQILSNSELLALSTVRIECELKTGGVATGTGFFYNFLQSDQGSIPAIVTNKHVIKEASIGHFHMNLAGPDGAPLMGQHLRCSYDNFPSFWIDHPDTEVDLCIMPIAPLLNHAIAEGKQLFIFSIEESLVPTAAELAELTALEDITMIGYPNGIWDKVNNMPIIRRGITATHPNVNYEGRREFMIDAACFPGSSGSPVFLFNPMGYATKQGGINMGTRIKLLGILYAGPQHTAEGEIVVVNVPTIQKPIAVSAIPNNLGLVIKAERLKDFNPILQKLLPQ